MAVVARGTVQDRPWGRTMSFVADRRFSGELIVDSDSRRYVVSFDDGAVVAAISPLATDAAVRVALTAGLVMSSQVADIGRQVAARSDLDEVDAVAVALRLAPDQVDKLRRRVIAHKAIRGFALERGEFVLSDERHLPFSPNHAIDVRALIYLGARTHMTEQRLLQDLARLGPGFQLRADAIASLPQYGFSEAEKPILAALRAAPIATLDLDAAAPELDPRTARAVVYSLAVTNALEIATTSVGMDRPHSASKTPPSGMDRIRKPTSQSRSGVERPRGGSGSPSGTSPGSPSYDRMRKASTDAGEARPKSPSDSGERPVKPPSDPGFARTKAPSVSGFDRGKSASTPIQDRGKPASNDPGFTRPPPQKTAEPATRPAAKKTSEPGFDRGKKPSVATAMPSADDSVSMPMPPRGKGTTSSPGTLRGKNLSQAGEVIDSREHRRPTRRSSLHSVNLPVAAEVRALIRQRADLMEQGANHFALLGVGADAPGEDIRRTYFGLARQLHPDRLTALGIPDEDRAAQRLFAQINTAFAILSSPTRRADYRKTLDAGGERVVRAQQDQAEALARKLMAAEEQFQIGAMALRRDQLDVALTHFKEAVRLNPEEADHHAMLAWTIFAAAPDKTAVFKEVRGLLEKGLRLAPKAVTPRLYLGRVARMMNRDKEAMDQFEEVLRLAPGHSEAASELRVLEQRHSAGPKDPDGKGGGGLFGRFKK